MHQIVRSLLINNDGKILLVRHRNKDYWSLPGGHIEKGEDIYKALKRELKEELGIKIRILGSKTGLKLSHIKELPQALITYKIKYKTKKGKEEKRLEYIFKSEIKPNQIIKTQIEEIDEYKWFSIQEIKNLNTFEQVKEIVNLV